MQRNIGDKIFQQIVRWRIGIAVIILISLARMIGSLQFFEWMSLDYFLRQLPSEPIDERIVIVGIDDRDIREIGSYPISDRDIARLLRKLQTYKPAVIGLDLVRDIPVEPGYQERVKVFQESKNLIAIERVLGQDIIVPPATLAEDQIGFADIHPDADGHVRRNILGTWRDNGKSDYVFSLSLRLAEAFLKTKDITLENGIRDSDAMRFGETELPRFFAHTGGYIGADDGGVQILLNYRRGKDRFRTFSFQDILNDRIEDPNWLRDSIVIIGMTAASAKDPINTLAIANVKSPGTIHGVEFHAHATSQIISAVLDGRPLLRTWADGWEYLWITTFGLLAIPLGGIFRSPLHNLFWVVILSFVPIGVSYLSLWVWGWWIPIVPAWLVFMINGIAYTAFYQNERTLKYQIEVKNLIIQERQSSIKKAFDTIHNGPLQTLAHIQRRVREQDSSGEELLNELENLNTEIRNISDYLQQESAHIEVSEPNKFLENCTIQPKSFHLGNGKILDLSLPIDELLQIVYSETSQRPYFPNFGTIKAKIVKFDPIESCYLNPKQKQQLCLFLEEALCNVGKHAQGATRLIATGTKKEGQYILKIEDNGSGIISSNQGRGTKQCRDLEKLLGGIFKRHNVKPKGTLCEITWKLTEPNPSFFRRISAKFEQFFSYQNYQR